MVQEALDYSVVAIKECKLHNYDDQKGSRDIKEAKKSNKGARRPRKMAFSPSTLEVC